MDYHTEYSALCGPNIPPDSLQDCFRHIFGRRQADPHDALSDAQATADVFEDLAMGASQVSHRLNGPTHPNFLRYLDVTRRRQP